MSESNPASEPATPKDQISQNAPNDTSDTVNTILISGTTFFKTDLEPAENVRVALILTVDKKSNTVGIFQSGEDGKFEFDVSDETKFPPKVNYTIQGYLEGYMNNSISGPISMLSKNKNEIILRTVPPNSLRSGKRILLFLFLLLSGIIATYIFTHKDPIENKRSIETRFPVDSLLIDQLVSSADTLIHRGQEKTATRLDTTFVTSSHNNVKRHIDSLVAQNKIDQIIYELKILEHIVAVDTAIKYGQYDLIGDHYRAIQNEEAQHRSYFWRDAPFKWLEILLWALIATLIKLMLTAGYFLYTREYNSDNHWNDLGLIIAAPVIALVISFIISFVTIDINLGSSRFILDLTQPELAIIIAVLIGLSPWRAWRFLNKLSQDFIGFLPSFTNSEEEIPKETEPKPKIKPANNATKPNQSEAS